jgi:hypothetical protein
MSNNAVYKVEEVGIFQIVRVPKKDLEAGEVGYLIAGIKTVSDTRCGDTITHEAAPCDAPMPGFKEAKPVVFSSLYPVASDGYEDLPWALEKLKLNDASLVYEKDTSAALGFGFRCGFLGLLAPGGRPGAPGARIRPVPDSHGPVGALPHRPEKTAARKSSTIPPCIRIPRSSNMPRSRSSERPSSSRTATWAP